MGLVTRFSPSHIGQFWRDWTATLGYRSADQNGGSGALGSQCVTDEYRSDRRQWELCPAAAGRSCSVQCLLPGRRPRRIGDDGGGVPRGGAGIEGRVPRPAGAPRRPDHQPSEGWGRGCVPRRARLIFACRPHQPATGTGGVGPHRSAAQPADPLPAMDPGWDEHRGATPARPALGARTTWAVMSRSSACCSRRRVAACPARVPEPGKAVRAVR